MEIKDVVKKLVGEIDPIGSTHVDDVRFENLKVMCKLVQDLIDEIYMVKHHGENAYQNSIKVSGEYAAKILKDIKESV